MTEWDAAVYVRRSGLQEAMAREALAFLHLNGNERVLDIGCGDGRITAQIASRLPHGAILGTDSSRDMIAYAAGHAQGRNIAFQVADAAHLSFRNEFNLIVSFNTLHWLPDPDSPLRSIHDAMSPRATAQLRLVPDGPRKSLERVIVVAWTRRLPEAERASFIGNIVDNYAKVAADAPDQVNIFKFYQLDVALPRSGPTPTNS